MVSPMDCALTVPEPQMENELVEVPVVVSQQHFVQQNVDFPVLGARGLLGGGGFNCASWSRFLRWPSTFSHRTGFTCASWSRQIFTEIFWAISQDSSEDADFATEDELVEVRHDDWVSMVDEHGRCFLWNRRYDTTHWNVPPGMLRRWVCYGRCFLELESQVEVEFLRGLDGG